MKEMLHNTFRILATFFLVAISCALTWGQIAFTDGSSLLAYDYLKSGVTICVADMNGDGYDDIIRLSNADTLKVEYQQPDGTFKGLHIGNADGSTEWSMSVADVDQNGYNDIITGGNQKRLKLYRANKIGSAFTIDTLMRPLPHSFDIYTQATGFADIDNDGFIDFFACNDNGLNSVYENDGTGTFIYDADTSMINTKSVLPMGTEFPDNVNSGNYGIVWTDYDWDGDIDLYISKCKLGVTDTLDGRRVNLLLQNDGAGNYTEVGEAAGLRPYEQSWAATFGDLDNDGDMDCFIVNHGFSRTSQFYRNNGDGTFTDVTASTGVISYLNFAADGIQVLMEDFDNDTYLDVYITSLYGISSTIFRNNGNFTFSNIELSLGEIANAQSAAAGDLDHDGFVDLMIGFAQGFNSPNANKSDLLQLNAGNSNHFLNVSLIGTTCNINGIGAGIEIYGGFGKQIREVRAGEGYGIQNSMSRNFGLGSYTTLDSLKVIWPSGNVDKYENVSADQFLRLREGCTGNLTSYTVTNLNDSGIGSLREIIQNACDFDTIFFDPILAGDTIILTSGEVVIDRSIIIDGMSGSDIYISGNNASRIFNILPRNEVLLKDLGLIHAEGSGINGSAIYNAGALSIQNLYLADNMKDGLPRAIDNVGTLNVISGINEIRN